MQNWNEFNQWKKAGWSANTQDEYNQWKAVFKEWYKIQKLNEFERTKIKEQIKALDDAKNAYFAKQKSRPQPKVTYLLQPSLAEALTEYLKVMTELKKAELRQRFDEDLTDLELDV
jgi:hypothetical protein